MLADADGRGQERSQSGSGRQNCLEFSDLGDEGGGVEFSLSGVDGFALGVDEDGEGEGAGPVFGDEVDGGVLVAGVEQERG